MDNDIEREAFEKAMQGRAEFYWLDHAGQYGSLITQHKWATWQAARAHATAAPVVQGGAPEETINAVISLVKDAAAAHLNSEFNSYLNKIRKLITAAPTAPAVQGGGVPEPVAWRSKPSKPGRYVVKGFDSAGTEALVCVAEDDGELVCNLHDSNSDPLESYSNLMSQISDRFEWAELHTYPHNGEQGGEWVIQLRGEYLAARGIWERPDHRGYTNDIHEAGRYSEDEARKSEAMAPDKYKAVCLTRPQPPKSKEGSGDE